MKKIIGLVLLFCIQSAFATNLIQVYRQAVGSDPLVQQAQAKALASQADITITRSYLLPSLDATAGATLSHNNQGNPQDNGTVATYGLTLTQTLFNYSDWLNLGTAQLNSKAANAQYAAALQDLMVRVAKAYFTVAQAQDELTISLKNQKALAEKLRQTRLRFKAGLSQTDDVSNAEAAYDTSKINVINARATLLDMLAKLQAITGLKYRNVAGLKQHFPLYSPKPLILSKWLTAAKQHNLNIVAAKLSMRAAKENIQAQELQRLPNINASAGFSGNESKNNGIASTSNNAAILGVKLDWPIYQGGLITGQTRKAEADYKNAVGIYLQNYRAAISNTQQGFTNVLADIDDIRAGQAAVKSNAESLRSTEAAYQAGTRNIMDVLTAQQALFNAENAYLKARYQYLINYLSLKQAAGTLTEADLRMINRWL